MPMDDPPSLGALAQGTCHCLDQGKGIIGLRSLSHVFAPLISLMAAATNHLLFSPSTRAQRLIIQYYRFQLKTEPCRLTSYLMMRRSWTIPGPWKVTFGNISVSWKPCRRVLCARPMSSAKHATSRCRTVQTPATWLTTQRSTIPV